MDRSTTKPVLPIPQLRYETHPWKPSHAGYYSRSEIARQTGTYESSVPSAISHWNPSLSAEMIADLEQATLAVQKYEAYARSRIPDSSNLIEPMASILLRTESASSSQIERLTTSAKQLALAEIDAGKTNAQTVLANVRAMEAAIARADKLTLSSILDIHEQLLHTDSVSSKHAGKLREQLVWIGGRDTAGPLGAEYIAPQHTRLPELLDDLERFLDRDDLPVLLQAAVSHAQFETIHPFVDGNGRTGRALIHAVIRHFGLVKWTTPPISAGVLRDIDSYFTALDVYRSGDAWPIVALFSNSARYAAATGTKLIDDLVAELEESNELLSGVRPHSTVWRVLPLLIGQPVVSARYLKQSLEINDSIAQRTLKTLTDRGVLSERSGKSRNRIWQHEGILRVLDKYAAQIQRDSRSR